MTSIPPIKIPVVLNTEFGGYSLSRQASEEIARRKNLLTRTVHGQLYIGAGWNSVADIVPRNDPDLVAVVRELGEQAGKHLKVVVVSVQIEIESFDGKESVRVSGG